MDAQRTPFQVNPLFESRNFKSQERADLCMEIKQAASLLLEKINRIEPNQENGRLISLAKTHLEDSVMWGVKAISRE